jgi:hypothetical protein
VERLAHLVDIHVRADLEAVWLQGLDVVGQLVSTIHEE